MKLIVYVRAVLSGGRPALAAELGETLVNRFSSETDRHWAIKLLSYLPGDIAVPQLLRRFDLTLENAMQDRQEKTKISRLILGEGENALPFILAFGRSGSHLAWPIRMLEQLCGRREFVTVLLGLLSTSYPEFDKQVISRNHDILLGLASVSDERIPEALAPHLDSRYPEIRAAAEACLREQRGLGS